MDVPAGPRACIRSRPRNRNVLAVRIHRPDSSFLPHLSMTLRCDNAIMSQTGDRGLRTFISFNTPYRVRNFLFLYAPISLRSSIFLCFLILPMRHLATYCVQFSSSNHPSLFLPEGSQRRKKGRPLAKKTRGITPFRRSYNAICFLFLPAPPSCMSFEHPPDNNASI